MNTNEKIIKVFFRSLKLFIPITILICVIVAIFYYTNTNSYNKNRIKTEKLIVSLQKKHMTKELKRVINDMLVIAHQQEFLDLVKNNKNKRKLALANLTQEFIQKSIITKDFDQIRFINFNGIEEIRINFNNGAPKIVPKNKLQNKAHRYYFKECIKLHDGDIYLSKFDLNIENKKVQIPLKPMIRIGTPVFNSKREKVGIVIINYFGILVLNQLTDLDKFKQSKSMLVNDQGYWLKGPDPGTEWAFMYKDKQDLTFKNNFPLEWKKIKEQKNGQFVTSNGMFTFETIFQNKLLFGNLLTSEIDNHLKHQHKIKTRDKDQDYSWIIISRIPHSTLIKNETKWKWWSLLIAIILSIMWGGGAYSICWGRLAKELLIMKQVELLEEIKTNNEELSFSNEKMNKFVGIVAHDIRNPIGRIISFCEVLKEQKISNENRAMIDIIDNAAGEAIELVSAILDISALKAGHIDFKFGKFSIHSIINDVIYGLNFLAKTKNISINNSVDQNTFVNIDGQRISQVINNLISNAIKFSSSKSEINIFSKLSNDKISIIIEDFGTGISQENIVKLFDKSTPFSMVGTGDERGTGFGLVLCQELISAHNSEIKVESRLGIGSKFSFELEIYKS